MLPFAVMVFVSGLSCSSILVILLSGLACIMYVWRKLLVCFQLSFMSLELFETLTW